MTVLVGDKKVKKIIAGGNLFLSVDDIWQKYDGVRSMTGGVMLSNLSHGILSLTGIVSTQSMYCKIVPPDGFIFSKFVSTGTKTDTSNKVSGNYGASDYRLGKFVINDSGTEAAVMMQDDVAYVLSRQEFFVGIGSPVGIQLERIE
ncbi:hypothetical protein [Levilactobacillus wangkuiensis]|uniref:hypothetical protein n=1 Tax=Levilactobacillus wangkuiensis TaxID=2799566 RepID=UPI00194363A2|nr:hypothetical protein [Levilactobacillus wangkuiensis]